MKTILHITTIHNVFDTRIFRNECCSLAALGYNVLLVGVHDREEVVDGVTIIPISKYRNFFERIVTQPRKVIKIISKIKADIYHFHDPEMFLAMAMFAKKTGHKVVWDAHENHQERILSFNPFKIKFFSYLAAKSFGKLELSISKKYFSGVVTITEVMAQRYKKYLIFTTEVGNYSNIINLNHPKLKNSFETINFISSGAQFKQRGVIEIAKSLNFLNSNKKFHLIFAGKFNPESLRDEINSCVSDENRKKLSISGPHSWEDLVLAIIPSAHVGFVLFDTSNKNNCIGLPNRFFECWSNGLPVITTIGTEVARIVKEENAGIIIEDNSPENIALAMKMFLDNPDLISEMGQNARNAVEKKYSWNSALNNLTKFYDKILNE